MTPEFKAIIPNLMVKDIAETVFFYKKNFGFELVMVVDENEETTFESLPESTKPIFAMMKNGETQIFFQEEKSLAQDIKPFAQEKPGKAAICLYCDVKNVEEFYESIKNSVKIVKDFDTTWYGRKEFFVYDNNGYVLGFAEDA